MGSQKDKLAATRRRYTQEEKDQAVRLVHQARVEGRGDGAVARVARHLGFGVESVRTWVRQADVDAGATAGVTTVEAARICELGLSAGVASGEQHFTDGVGFLRGGARPPTSVTVEFIDAHRDEFGVEPICTVLQFAPSTYYAAKTRPVSARAVRDAVMMPVLMALWIANRKVYGHTSCGKRHGAAVTTSAATRSPG